MLEEKSSVIVFVKYLNLEAVPLAGRLLRYGSLLNKGFCLLCVYLESAVMGLVFGFEFLVWF